MLTPGGHSSFLQTCLSPGQPLPAVKDPPSPSPCQGAVINESCEGLQGSAAVSFCRVLYPCNISALPRGCKSFRCCSPSSDTVSCKSFSSSSPGAAGSWFSLAASDTPRAKDHPLGHNFPNSSLKVSFLSSREKGKKGGKTPHFFPLKSFSLCILVTRSALASALQLGLMQPRFLK